MRHSLFWALTLIVATMAYPLSGEASWRMTTRATTSVPAAQSPKKITIPAGTRILIRMVDSIDTTKQKAGYRFTTSLETNLQEEDMVVAPRGTTVYGRLAEASSAGRMS